MRNNLQARNGQRFRCRAIVKRFGTKNSFRGPPIKTILLNEVVEVSSGDLLTDHLWFTVGKWADGLLEGDAFEFEARASSYTKGYRGFRDIYDAAPLSQDWRLERPTKVKILPRVGATSHVEFVKALNAEFECRA